MMSTLRFGAAAITFALLQGLLTTSAMAQAREVVIVGTFKTPSGQLEDLVYETNAEYFGCRQALPGLKIEMQMQVQGYVETRGWMLESARCAYRTKSGEIEEFSR